jgi:hypothetical protein
MDDKDYLANMGGDPMREAVNFTRAHEIMLEETHALVKEVSDFIKSARDTVDAILPAIENNPIIKNMFGF